MLQCVFAPILSALMNYIQLTEFSIYLQQRPGELAGLLDAALAAGIEIISISTTEHLDRGCVRLLGTPEAALRSVCESMVEAGVGPVVESPVIGVSVENRPGIVRDLAVLMTDNRINVRYCYFVPASSVSQLTMCVFCFDEHDSAMQLLESTDWAVDTIGSDEQDSESQADDSAA